MEAASWEKATIEQSEMWGLSLDFSKFYDALDYSYLRDAMVHFGIDPTLADTLFRWQKMHSRRISYLGWIGEAFRPAKGIPQGCPLAVLQAIVCSMAWVQTLEQVLHPLPQPYPTLIVYLDGWSVLSPSQEVLATIAGVTTIWAQEWKIQLNPAKCTLAKNSYASAQRLLSPELSQVPVAHAQGLLGHDAGPLPTSDQQEERIQLALLKAHRILAVKLPNWAFRKMMKTYVTPLLFGLHSSSLSGKHRRLDLVIKRGSWGTARTASNWNLAQAMSVAATRLTSESFQFFEAFQVARQATIHESHRARLLQFWHSGILSMRKGPWQQLLTITRETEGVLAPGGVVEWQEFGIMINLHMPKDGLTHFLRQVWRSVHLRAAASNLEFLRGVPSSIDWEATRIDLSKSSTAHQTILAHGVNTKSRSFRHFGTGRSPNCEHGCRGEEEVGLQDHPEHRLLYCRGTQRLRSKHFERTHLTHLENQPLCTTRCSIWTLSDQARELAIPHSRAWGLSPTEGLVTRLIDIRGTFETRSAPPRTQFGYTTRDFGAHPLLKVHSAGVCFEGMDIQLSAYVQMHSYSKRDWECEAMSLAALVACLWRCRVTIGGLTTPKERIVADIMMRKRANAYLVDVISQQFHAIDLERGENLAQWRLHDPCDEFSPPHDPVHQLSTQWETAKRLIAFNSEVLDAYPVALSRHKGLAPPPPAPLVPRPGMVRPWGPRGRSEDRPPLECAFALEVPEGFCRHGIMGQF